MSSILKKINDRSIFNYINIFLLIIPLIIVVLSIFSISKIEWVWYYLILYLGLLSFIVSIYYIYKNRVKIVNKKEFVPLILLLIFLIWTIITSLLSDNVYLTIMGSSYRREGIFTYICYAGFFLTGILMINRDKNKFYNLFIAVGIILSIYMFYKCEFNISNNSLLKYRSIFYQFNHFGYFLYMSIICSVNMFINANNKKYKILYLISFIILFKTLTINDTLGSYLAVFGTLILLSIYHIIIKKNIKPILIIMSLFLILSFNFKNPKNSIIFELFGNFVDVSTTDYTDEKQVDSIGTGRGKLWKCTIELIKEKPILGYGLDNIGNRMYKLGCGNDRPHNDILQLSAFTGIPGMIIYISSIVMTLLILLKNIKKLDNETITACSAVIAYLISSLTANSMYYTTPYYMIFLGFTMNFIYEKYLKD